MRTISLDLDGMSSWHCVARVPAARVALPGVGEVRSARLVFDPEVVSTDDLPWAVAAPGYPVTTLRAEGQVA